MSASNPEYNLRPRGCRRPLPVQTQPHERPERRPPKGTKGGSKATSKPRPPPLSKYRRRTANARERGRMQELNVAFERLRSAVPQIPEVDPANSGGRLTKITTLRLAVNYIAALTKVLKTEGDEEDDEGTSASATDTPDSSMDQGSSLAELSTEDEELADFLMMDTENLLQFWSDDDTLQGSC